MPSLPIHHAINSIEGNRDRDKGRELARDTGQIFTTNFFHDNCADLVYQSGYTRPSSDPLSIRYRSRERKFQFSLPSLTIRSFKMDEIRTKDNRRFEIWLRNLTRKNYLSTVWRWKESLWKECDIDWLFFIEISATLAAASSLHCLWVAKLIKTRLIKLFQTLLQIFRLYYNAYEFSYRSQSYRLNYLLLADNR